ncbi:MAG: replication initiation protein [Brevinematales bacterium]|nr:replication initiation protein [Brevinematales bacterium]
MDNNEIYDFKKDVTIIAISHNLTALELRIYNTLVMYAQKSSNNSDSYNQKFSIPLRTLMDMSYYKSKNYRYFLKSLEAIKKTEVKIDLLNDKLKGNYLSAYLCSQISFYEDQPGLVFYEFSSDIVKLVLDPKKYAPLQLMITNQLESKFSMILYGLIQFYRKVEIPEMDIMKFRELFGILNKYESPAHIMNEVLKPAVNEINHSPQIPYIVTFKFLPEGAKIKKSIKFRFSAKNIAIGESSILDKDIVLPSRIFDLIPSAYRGLYEIIEMLQRYIELNGAEYVVSNMVYTNEKNPKKNYIAYLTKALESDYAAGDRAKNADFERIRREKEEQEKAVKARLEKEALEKMERRENRRKSLEAYFNDLPDEKKEGIKETAIIRLESMKFKEEADIIRSGKMPDSDLVSALWDTEFFNAIENTMKGEYIAD